MSHEERVGQKQLAFVLLFIVGSIVLAQLLKSTYSLPSEREVPERIWVVETLTVSPQPERITFATTGTVEAKTEIQVVPRVTGRVEQVHPDFYDGGTFQADAKLFTVDPTDFAIEAKRLAAQRIRAASQLEVEHAEADAAIAGWKQLHGDEPIPYRVARKPQLAEAQANLQAVEAELESAQVALARTQFTLPFNGRVLSSNVATGQQVVANQSYGRVFDRRSLEIEASLPDQQLKWLLNAEEPEIWIEVVYLGESRRHRGQLLRAASSLDTGTRFATVRFGFKESMPDLIPGLFARIEVTGAPIPGAMRLPIEAVQDDGRIWLMNAESRLTPHEATLLFSDEHYAIVTGITNTVTVVVSRLSGATPGMQVRAFEDTLGAQDG